jgi:Holliday junction resolvasome RuvABC endonuclease subunit
MVEKARTGSAIASRWRSSGAVLGIDLALENTGLSIFTNTGIHHRCMTIQEKLSRGTKKDPPIPEPERIERMLRIANEIVRVMTLFKVRHVGIEGAAHNAKFQSHQLGEVAGVVKSQIWMKFGIAPRVIPPEVIETVEQGLGVVVENDHEADATIIARYTFDMVVAEEEELR